MASHYEIEQGGRLRAALREWIAGLTTVKVVDAQYEAAIAALDKALVGTITYMKRRREGHPQDWEREQYLTNQWNVASQAVSPLDPDLSNACMMKGLGWTDPTIWDAAQKRGFSISLESMQEARWALNRRRQAATTASASTEARALRLLEAIYDRTHETGDPVFVEDLASDVELSKPEAQAAWRYLSEKHLIKTFRIPYTARINTNGQDIIEKGKSEPDQPVRGFGQVTYNTINIHNMNHSSIQQAGADSSLTQSNTYGAADLRDLKRALELLEEHLEELDLASPDRRRARTQIATLNAQLSGDPDPGSMREIGKTLRNITEGAVASLIATAGQPALWGFVAEVFKRWFA
jgi:hypothetical protein